MPFAELALTEGASAVRDAGALPVEVAIVAGSGFGGLSARIENALAIPYARIPGVPSAGAPGHAGRLLVGTLGETPVALFDGRAHLYEGLSAFDAAFTARLAAAMGATTVVLTNASGAVDPALRPGELVMIADHLNLTGQSPLEGWRPLGSDPFVPMTDAWDRELRRVASQTAADIALGLPEVVYAQVPGPQFETPAEVAMYRALGADVVGMSTVVEAIAARALGMRVLGLSLVTNAAAGEGLSHASVIDVGALASESVEALLVGILQRL